MLRWIGLFLGSMLPQYMALCVSQFDSSKKNLCVYSLGYIVGAYPPLCVCSIGNTVGACPPQVCSFIGRQSLLDPCMLPTLLCRIFFHSTGYQVVYNCLIDREILTHAILQDVFKCTCSIPPLFKSGWETLGPPHTKLEFKLTKRFLKIYHI